MGLTAPSACLSKLRTESVNHLKLRFQHSLRLEWDRRRPRKKQNLETTSSLSAACDKKWLHAQCKETNKTCWKCKQIMWKKPLQRCLHQQPAHSPSFRRWFWPKPHQRHVHFGLPFQHSRVAGHERKVNYLDDTRLKQSRSLANVDVKLEHQDGWPKKRAAFVSRHSVKIVAVVAIESKVYSLKSKWILVY